MKQPTIDQINHYNQTHKNQTITALHQTIKTINTVKTSTSTSTTDHKTTTPTTFPDLIKAYNTDPNNTDNLLNLAAAVTYSVLRKVIDPTRKRERVQAMVTTDKATRRLVDYTDKTLTTPASVSTMGNGNPANSGHSPALVALRQSLTRDRAYLARLTHAINGATSYTYDKDGNTVREVVDADLYETANNLIRQALTGDGLDLLDDAVLSILSETEKQATREPGQPIDLERPYTVKRLKRRVYIRVEESVNGWEEVDTTPIQEVFKAVRRTVRSSRAVQADPRNGYIYLSFLTTDGEGHEEILYRRLPRYMDVGSDGSYTPAGRVAGCPAGLDGRPTNYTADHATVEDMDNIMQRLHLTDRESAVIKYRMQGYGYRAISTAMGVTVDNAKRCGRRIQEKARAAGLDPAPVK